jgi:hypothetical protein
MWELGQLHQALAQYAQRGLTPEDREENRTDGWAKVSSILGQESMLPPVDYSISPVILFGSRNWRASLIGIEWL